VDDSSTLLLVEDNLNYLEFALSACSEGRLDYLLRRAASLSQGAEYPSTRLLGLNDQPSSAVERDL